MASFSFREISEETRKALLGGDAGLISHTDRERVTFSGPSQTLGRDPLCRPPRAAFTRPGLPTRAPRGRRSADGSKMAAGRPAHASSPRAARGTAWPGTALLAGPGSHQPEPTARSSDSPDHARPPRPSTSPWWRRGADRAPARLRRSSNRKRKYSGPSPQYERYSSAPYPHCHPPFRQSVPYPNLGLSPFGYVTTCDAELCPFGGLCHSQPPLKQRDSFLSEGSDVTSHPASKKCSTGGTGEARSSVVAGDGHDSRAEATGSGRAVPQPSPVRLYQKQRLLPARASA